MFVKLKKLFPQKVDEKLKVIFKGILFCVFVSMGIRFFIRVLYPLNDIVRNWNSFYSLEEQSVDILIVGSSHAYSSFNTDMICDHTGEDAYILASNSQTVVQSYYNVKEALKYQAPKTIILEAFSFNGNNSWKNGNSDNDDKDWKKESNIDGMRFGAVKLEAVREQYYPKNWLYALFPLARCHGNWADTAQICRNYSFFKEIHKFSPFRPSKSAMSTETMQKYAQAEKDTSEIVISETNILHFHKLAALCREKGIELYVVMAPMYDVYIDSINYESWTSKILALTESEQVTYLDCNLNYDRIGLNAQDFEDTYNSNHHLNASGAEKVSRFVEEELYGTEKSR